MIGGHPHYPRPRDAKDLLNADESHHCKPLEARCYAEPRIFDVTFFLKSYKHL